MSQTNLTNVKVIPDVDLWKLEIMFGKRYFSVLLRRQDNLFGVIGRLLALAKKLEGALPDRATELRNEAESGGTTEACPASNHATWASFPDPCKFCPDCGKRLLP